MGCERQSFAFKFSFLNRINKMNFSDAEFRALINACLTYAERGTVTKFNDRLLNMLFLEFCEYENFCYQRWRNVNEIDRK